jgi:Repeat of unknown function (DUF5907)
MTAQKDSERTALSAANLDDTALWHIVDKLGASVKMTFAQFKTALASALSMTGDVSASVSVGVATTTIGALKVLTSMIAASAVTYAKIQNVSATSRLLGRYNAGAGSAEEIALGSSYLTMSGGTMTFPAAMIAQLSPVMKPGDQVITDITGARFDVTGQSLTVAANTKYAFEFVTLFLPETGNPSGNYYGLDVTVPSSPTSLHVYHHMGGYGVTTANDAFITEYTTASDAAVGYNGAFDANDVHVNTQTGILRNGANAGTIQLRAFVPATGSFTVKAGSWCRLTVLG